MKSSFCIDLQRFMLIPTKFPLSPNGCKLLMNRQNNPRNIYLIFGGYLNYRLKVIRLLLFQQVWSQALRSFVALLHLPILYLCLVAAEQYVGHFPAFVFCRSGVDRC